MEAQSLTSFCCFFAAAWLASPNWPLNEWYSVVSEHFGLQHAAQRSCIKFTRISNSKNGKKCLNIPSGSETVIIAVFNIRIVFLSSLERHWKQVNDSDYGRCLIAHGTPFKEWEHKFGLQLHQLFHHILRKYSLTQANPKAYCQQNNYGFTQLVHKLCCVQGKMIVPLNDLSPQCLSLVWNVPLGNVCWRLPSPVCVDRRSAGR